MLVFYIITAGQVFNGFGGPAKDAHILLLVPFFTSFENIKPLSFVFYSAHIVFCVKNYLIILNDYYWT